MKRDKNKIIIYVAFAILMMVLGASDAMRGIVAPIFGEHFALTASGLSLIITISYIGNLVFLFVGGKLMDKLSRKNAMLLFGSIWLVGLLVFLLTNSFVGVLIGVFLATGASTMLSTAITLTTPLLFLTAPGVRVNTLFFVQGIGTSGSQSIVGNYIKDFTDWHTVVAILIGIGVVALGLMAYGKMPLVTTDTVKAANATGENKKAIFILLSLIFGFYFIAEHGVMNWLVSYGTQVYGMSIGDAANLTALFFGSVMIGRLGFSKLIDRLGIFKSIKFFATAATILYVLGFGFGRNGLWIIALSGLMFSVIYPTLVMSIAHIWPPEVAGGIGGKILSIASLADILFNASFGVVTDKIGLNLSFLSMPLSMIACAILIYVLVAKVKNVTLA